MNLIVDDNLNMNKVDLLKEVSRDHLKNLSRQEIIELLLGEQSIRRQLEEQRDQAQVERLLIVEVKKRFELIFQKN